MAGADSRSWTRLQDWVSLFAGGYLALSPLWVDVHSAGSWAIWVIGIAIVLMAFVALALPGAYIDEWMTAAAGAVAFAAPWLFSYDDQPTAARTSWIVGVVVFISALAAVPASRDIYRQQHHAA